MRNNLLSTLTLAGCFCISSAAFSQSPDETERNNQPNNNNNPDNTYAVTDIVRSGLKWNSLRTLDLRTGLYSNILVQLLNNNETQVPPGAPAGLTQNSVAAIAYDQDNRRVYFTAMLTDKLYYIDLRSMNRYVVTNHFTGLLPKTSDQSNIITRMVIGEDNKGYALTNDGMHFIRFRTSNNSSVTDLGSLIDAPGNNEMSVHNLCSSFGGDLIADDDDHLYLFTSRNHVFKINIQTRVAKFLGTISNLPPNFTTSGVVVNKQEKKIVVVSAVDSSDIYTVDPERLVARPFNANRPYHPADLANGFVLQTRKHDHHEDNWLVLSNGQNNDNVRLFPNPVADKQFKIQFTDVNPGSYTIDLTDTRGMTIMTKSITIGGKVSIVSLNLPGSVTSGIYFVRISGGYRTLYSGKMVVE